MRVLSLFSGAGGADLALEAAGFAVSGLCEIEPHARAVLREHWPDVPLHGDVSTLDGTQYKGAVDVVVGGSPCQDLSVAGKRAGLTEGSGTRSSLFYEQVRIWNESGAPYLIWENVKGAFSSSKGADFAAVLSAIVGRDIAVPLDGWKRKSGGVVCGPAAVAAWRLLDLQHFGVPQRRERIVVLAARAGGVDPAEVLAVGQSLRGDSPPRFAAREGVASDSVAGADGEGGADGGLTLRDINLVRFGRGLAPHSEADWVKAVNISNGAATLDNVMGTLDTDGASTTAIGNQTRGVVIAFAQNQLGEVRTSDTMGTLNTNSNASGRSTPMVLAFAQNQRDEVRDLGAVAGALAGEPGMKQQNYVLTYDARGNGDGQIVNTLAGDHQNRVTDYTALVLASGDSVAATITADYGDKMGLNDQHIYSQKGGLFPMSLGVPRRLMPVECERLMGWPDDWTRYGVNEKGVRYELADTPRYKLCGNGIGREWMEWVGLRLLTAELSTQEVEDNGGDRRCA